VKSQERRTKCDVFIAKVADNRNFDSPQPRGLAMALGYNGPMKMNTFQVISPFQPQGDQPQVPQLGDRLDPSTATVAQFGAIPDLGEKRTLAIVDFRVRC
jgi:hypothetical protein